MQHSRRWKNKSGHDRGGVDRNLALLGFQLQSGNDLLIGHD